MKRGGGNRNEGRHMHPYRDVKRVHGVVGAAGKEAG